MVTRVLETTKALIEHPELITVPGEKSAAGSFLGLQIIETKRLRFFPKNVESYDDSVLFRLLLICCDIIGETPMDGDFELPTDYFIDANDLPAKCYWQGILKGLSLMMHGMCETAPPKRDPFKSGIWYVQARVLNNLGLDNIAISIPKRQGIFDFTSRGRSGFSLAHTIICAEIINHAIDKMRVSEDLFRCVLLDPNDLKSQSKIRHKRPSQKKVIFLFSEVDWLQKNVDPIFEEKDQELWSLYNNVHDKESYVNYVELIRSCNKQIAKSCRTADKLARIRAAKLFKRGMTGDQESRIDQLELDELTCLHPSYWAGLKITLPRISSREDKFFDEFQRIVLEYDTLIKKTEYKGFLNEWYTILNSKLSKLGLPKLELTSVQDANLKPYR